MQSFRDPCSLEVGLGHYLELQSPLLELHTLHVGTRYSASGKRWGNKTWQNLQKVCMGQDPAWSTSLMFTLYYPKLSHTVRPYLARQAGKSDVAIFLGEE